MFKRLSKFGLGLVLEFLVANTVWGIAVIVALSNLFYSGGYSDMSNNVFDWVMVIISLIGLVFAVTVGNKVYLKLKDKWNL